MSCFHSSLPKRAEELLSRVVRALSFNKIIMADSADVNVTPVVSSQPPGKEEQGGGEGGEGAEKDAGGGLTDAQTEKDAGGGLTDAQTEKDAGGGLTDAQTEKDAGGGLTDAQSELLERCLHSLKHAKNDSHTLAALLLITRMCPASQLDKPTLRRIFEAVGLNLPARLLVTAVREGDNSSLPPHELLSLGTALLAALSTDPDMASHPQLLATIPLLLGILANGPVNQQKQAAQVGEMGQNPDWKVQSAASSTTESNPANVAKSAGEGKTSKQKGDDCSEGNRVSASQETSPSSKLDEAMAADCYQVLTAVCALPKGPDQLLSRGAVPSLCQAVEQNQTLSHKRGLALLGCLLSGKNKDKVWSKHPAELLTLLARLSKDFCQARDQTRLDMCAQLVQFLPPVGVAVESEELKGVVARVWGALRPMLQAKLTPRQIGPILVLSACLLDLYGWELVGPPKFCCLLVNRACVEVRMGLEEPPGNDLSPELQQTLTGCYRIMEAAIEQACCLGVSQTTALPQSSVSSLSLQQSRQVLGVLEEAFSALMYHLQQVDPSRYDDPFIFATFRSLCSWLAEETSCLKEEVTRLLPFLIGYSRSHLQAESPEQGLSGWMAEMSVREEREGWTGREALRYLLPALCHLSAEEGPRKVLLTLDTPALLVDFLSQCWTSLKGKSGVASARDPSMETACSALLNFTVTEPERVRKDPCFRTLEALLSEALPVLVHKPRLVVLAANYCTLGLMIGRLKSAPSGSVEAGQKRFFSTALRFLLSALESGSSHGPVRVSPSWEESWDEAAELWRLCLQALGGCVRAQPWITTLVRDEGWLKHTLTMLSQCNALPDQHTQEALEEALCAMAGQCPVCELEIGDMMRNDKGALSCMRNLKKSVVVK
ncbi:neurochondrin isoform X2 [Micropterus dolomieu]|uniref:neurochondrin isoform X2 n=1 Tax=Micropterus dolomieu TaxID=147949 RepID=UPI001E8EB9DB|nr:neurochondrin isoform X2 [Micropterus dolomieu]